MSQVPMDIPSCPFCSFSDDDNSFVAEHVEFCHPEYGTAPVAEHTVTLNPTNETPGGGKRLSSVYDQEESTEKYLKCPNGCGELVAAIELSTHLDLHFAEGIALEDIGVSPPEIQRLGFNVHLAEEGSESAGDLEASSSFQEDQQMPKKERSWGALQQAGKVQSALETTAAVIGGMKRLGRAELGPHAHEKRMPSWLKRMLEKGAKTTQSNCISPTGTLVKHEAIENGVSNVIPVLIRLCEEDRSVQRALFCSSGVRQIFKLPREGGFCGYRNIQMLISYIRESQSQGHGHFPQGIPTILELQDMIENAWDLGFNSVGRIETGGIRGTRKYIGTPEAQALFQSLGIACEANSFSETTGISAHNALYTNVAEYFRQAGSSETKGKVIQTSLPPIYLQHQGHSMTVIGFEIRNDGSANLLVFDPMFKTPPGIKCLLESNTKLSDPARHLKAYRRGTAYLQKYKDFEVLKLSSPKPSSQQ